MTVALFAALAAALVVIACLTVVCRESFKEQRHTDSLTRLPNRLGFEAILEENLKRELPFSVVWLDLDGFRRLNELHGFAGGDTVLSQIGPRIRRFLRTGDAVARFGGGQFLILLRGHDETAGITSPILHVVNASAGVSRYPEDGDGAAQLLLCAETAMRQAKVEARGSVLSFHAGMAAGRARRVEIADLIQSALANDRFHLVYQPIVDADGEIVRMESLVRIEDPVLGRVAPLDFIGVAEQTGLMVDVGGWIIREACRQARAWSDAGLETQVTINVSPCQLASAEFAIGIVQEVLKWGLPKRTFTLHITGELKSIAPTDRLRRAGIRISSQQPLFDEVRVNEPFEVPADRPDLIVVARGIETPEQLDAAHAAGCHLFQGFQIAPPLESADATEILRVGLFAGSSGIVRS